MSCYQNQSASTLIWRAFYTFSKSEKRCEQQLKENNIDVFLPVQTVIRQWKDRKKKIQEPLFRNYIFARVDERDRIKVLRTPGIVRCIAFGGVPIIITEEEIDQIRLLQSYADCLLADRLERVDIPANLIGTNVRIEQGMMSGLNGEVVQIRGENRLMVRISFMNIAFKVNVPYSFTKIVQGAVVNFR